MKSEDETSTFAGGELFPPAAVPEHPSHAPNLLSAQPCLQTLKLRPWGGTYLWRGRGLDHPQRGLPLGESWEFSTLKGSESRCLSQPLQEVLGHPLPFLAKLVDVRRPLSVQVHPEGPQGKEEAWVILDAEPGAQIMAGLRPGVSAQDFAQAIAYAESAHGRQDVVFACLQSHPVQAGSVVIVPPRTVHTIPSSLLFAEIQDPVDITYRFFDYGSERPTHRELAFASLDPDAQPVLHHATQSSPRLSVRGERVCLELLAAGEHIISWERGERLVIPAQGRTRVQHKEESEQLERGELRLARGGPLKFQLDADAHAVLAWLMPQP